MYTCQHPFSVFCQIVPAGPSLSGLGLAIEKSFQSGIANFQFIGGLPPGYISAAKALQNISKTDFEAWPIHYPGSADLMAFLAGPLHTGLDPFSQDASFQLSIGHGYIIEGFTKGRGGIQPGLGIRPETDSPGP